MVDVAECGRATMSVGQCVVASLILALVMLKQGGRTKDRKKIEKTAQEPVKVGGPVKPREEDRSGTVTPVVSSIGLTGTAIKGNLTRQPRRSVDREEVAPSLRALRFDGRKEGRGSSDSHGSSSHQSGAKARGAAAINTMDGPGKACVTVDVDALAGSLEVNLRVTSAAAGSSGGQSVHEDVDEWQPRRGYGQPQSTSTTTSKDNEERRFEVREESKRSENKTTFEQDDEMRPWDLSAYQSIRPASTDAWDLDYWKNGWICRRHHKERKQPFHPVHRSTPVNTKMLDPSRVSVRFYKNGEKQVVVDEWTAPRMSKGQEDQPWRGYTFFRARKDPAVGSSHPSSCEAPPSEYEFVDEDP